MAIGGTSFSIETQRALGGVVLRLSGELDLSGTEALKDALTSALESNGTVTIDLDALSFIDSAGIAAMLEAEYVWGHGGHALKLRGGTGQVRRVLEITAIDRLMDWSES